MTAWFLAAAGAFAAGDYFGILTPQYLYYYCVAAVVLIVLLAVLVKFKPQGYAVAVCGVLLFCACGMAVGSRDVQPDAAALDNYIGHKVTLYGSVDLLSLKERDDGVSFVMDCRAVQKEKGSLQNAGGKVRVFAMESQTQQFNSSDIAVSGELKAVHGFANPGSFDSESWNLQQGIKGRISVKKAALHIGSDQSLSDKFFLFALGLRDKIRSAVPGEAGAVLCGMALGGFDGLSEATREASSATGLEHIL